MKCSKCGTDNKRNAKFCIKCGAPMRESERKYNYKLILLAIIVIIIAVSVIFLFTSDNLSGSHESVEVDGVTFNIPQEGYFKAFNNYRFDFNNKSCFIKKVEHFEASDSSKSIESVKLSKYYPGAEIYKTFFTDSGNNYMGLKFKKEDKWFHISVKTDNEREAIEFFDWMYENNDWEGHQ